MAWRVQLSTAALGALLAIGCDKPKAEELIKKESTIAERHDSGTVFWNVDADGEAQVVVKNPTGTILTREVEGKLKVEVDGEAPVEVQLAANPERGVFTAELPDLDAEVTTIEYELSVEGKPIEGALFLPEAGTEGLAEAAIEAEGELSVEGDAEVDGEVKGEVDGEVALRGEHGGVIQVVDGRKVEVAAHGPSGEVRVYLLDAEWKPKKMELAVDAGYAHRVELKLHAEGYFVADLDAKIRPHKLTLVVTDDDDHAHLVLVGYRPKVVLAVHRPPVIWVHHHWKHRGLARGHYKGTVHGPPGHYKKAHVKIDDHHGHHHRDHVTVDVKVKGVGVKAKGKGDVKVHVKSK